MTRIERKRVEQCKMSNCKHYKYCYIKWGSKCKLQQGYKIPKFVDNRNMVIEYDGDRIYARKMKGNDIMFG